MRLAALLICLALPVSAQSPEAAADAARDRLQAAAVQLQGATTSGNRVRALTETVLAYETGLAAMRDGLRQVAARERELTEDLAAQRADLGGLIGMLQRIGRVPTPVLRSHPDGPVAAARIGGVVADMTPAIQQQIDGAQAQLAALERVRSIRAQSLETLQSGLDGAQAARAQLGAAISDRSDLPQRFEEDPVQTALLLASAQTLAEFAAGLAGTLPASDARLTPQGNLPLPSAGYVLPDSGDDRPGIEIAAPPQGLVTTPVQATLLFRGLLPDYGTVVILEPAADILFIIAGMADTYGTVGQILPQGTPIGIMGGTEPGIDAELSEISGFDDSPAQQTLYLEVRDGQSAVNPDAWFALE